MELSWQKNPSKNEILNVSQLSAIHVQSCCCCRRRRNENVKKAIGLDQQNNNFARARITPFFHISLPSLPNHEVKDG